MKMLLILLAVSLAVSAVGWKYFIYFFSLGYGYGVTALAVALLIMYSGSLTWSAVALCAMLILFGCRLGTYLLLREKRTAAYRKILYDSSLQKKKPVSVIITVWLFCAILYVMQVSPVAFRMDNVAKGVEVSELWAWIGAAVIGYIGIVYVMFSGARRLEIRQNEVYGNDPEYQKYAKSTPILIPLLPLYSVEKYKWLQA